MAYNMSIAALKTKVVTNGGFQRNNRFMVTINGPTNISAFTSATGTDGPPKYIAETVLLPNITVLTQADSISGPGLGRTSPRGLAFKDGVLITFPEFGNWELLKGIDTWMNKLYYQASNQNARSWITALYQGNDVNISTYSLKVEALDINGNTKATYTFSETYQVELFPLQFSSQTTNEILKTTVRFAFRNYDLS